MNHTDSRYASLAFYYVRDRQSLARTEAVAFSGPGVDAMENFFEGDDDDVPVKCAILKTKDPMECVLAIDSANAGFRLELLCRPNRGCRTRRRPIANGKILKEPMGSPFFGGGPFAFVVEDRSSNSGPPT